MRWAEATGRRCLIWARDSWHTCHSEQAQQSQSVGNFTAPGKCIQQAAPLKQADDELCGLCGGENEMGDDHQHWTPSPTEQNPQSPCGAMAPRCAAHLRGKNIEKIGNEKRLNLEKYP